MQPLEEITIKRTLHLFGAVLQLAMRVLVKYRAVHQNKCLMFKCFFSHQWHAVKKLIVLSALWSKLTEVIRWRGNQRRGHPVAPTPKSWWLYVHDSQAHSRTRRSQQRSEINLKSRQMSSAFSLVLISGFSYMALQTRWTRVTKHKRCVSAQMKCSSSGYFCFSGRLKGALKIPKITRLNTSHWNTRSTDLSD